MRVNPLVFGALALASELGLPADTDPNRQIKDLEGAGFSTEKLRTWLKRRATR
jgi:hypothetical protein